LLTGAGLLPWVAFVAMPTRCRHAVRGFIMAASRGLLAARNRWSSGQRPSQDTTGTGTGRHRRRRTATRVAGPFARICTAKSRHYSTRVEFQVLRHADMDPRHVARTQGSNNATPYHCSYFRPMTSCSRLHEPGSLIRLVSRLIEIVR
jgi:hypothetical protein